MLLTGIELPASKPSANTFLPFSGKSTIFLFSITCPSEEVAESTNGVAAVTSMDSVMEPTVSAMSSARSAMPLGWRRLRTAIMSVCKPMGNP